jgi:hypothetical protein
MLPSLNFSIRDSDLNQFLFQNAKVEQIKEIRTIYFFVEIIGTPAVIYIFM